MVTAVKTSQQRPAIESGKAGKRAAAEAPRREDSRVAVVVTDPAAMMADMAEELGFLVAETSGGADELEQDKDAAFDDLISELIRKSILKAQEGRKPEATEELARLRDHVVREGLKGKPGQELDEALRRFTGGSSQKGLAMLAELVDLSRTDPGLQALGFDKTTLEDYAVAREAGLTAALNLAEVLTDGEHSLPDTAERMLSTYENSIAASQSILQTFHRLGQSEGIANVSDWTRFLTEAVAADLSKQNSSTEKAQLTLILAELKGFRTFNTLTQGLERLAKGMPPGKGPTPAHLLQSTLNYIEQPLRVMPELEAMAGDLPQQGQILFYQGFRNLLKSIPTDAYVSPEQKAGTLVPLQKRVDELTWSEDV